MLFCFLLVFLAEALLSSILSNYQHKVSAAKAVEMLSTAEIVVDLSQKM